MGGVRNLILLTGFEEFDGYLYNPSGEIAKLLDGKVIEGFVVKALILPVSLKRALRLLRGVLEELNPRIAIGVGLAPRASKVTLELVAVNKVFFQIPDEDGYVAKGEPVEEDGPEVVTTNLPVDEILRECLDRRGLPVTPGASIGMFLCNTVAYTLIRYAKRRGALGGFIHIPPDTTTAMRLGLRNSLTTHEIIESIKCILEVTAKCITK